MQLQSLVVLTVPQGIDCALHRLPILLPENVRKCLRATTEFSTACNIQNPNQREGKTSDFWC